MFRFPGRSINAMSGTFHQVDNWDNCSGFVLSSFDKEELYAFEPGREEGEFFFTHSEEPCLSENEYTAVGQEFIEQLHERKLDKAVFSRIKEISFDKNPRQFFFCLVDLYPDAFVYLLSSEKLGTWIGASPEILLSTEGKTVHTMALAGTLPAHDEGTWGRKELDEQEHVRNYIRECLKEAGVQECKEATRSEFQAGPVKHLVSRFSFEMLPSEIPKLALKLHPTPAVSGLPQREAVALIREFEPHQRSLYAGIIGWLGAQESHLFVNLRCGKIMDKKMHLYLGGGFTIDSIIEKEWIETENKARTLLDVIDDL